MMVAATDSQTRKVRSQVRGELMGYEQLIWIGPAGYQWSKNRPPATGAVECALSVP